MRTRSLEFLVPGALQTVTGGYNYDRRIIAGLRVLGWRITVHTLDASFPDPSAAALEHAGSVLAGLPDNALVLIDGLALGAMPHLARLHALRLALLALVHHPLAAESGIASVLARRLQQSERQALQNVRHTIVTSRATKQALLDYGIVPALVSIVEPGTDEGSHARSRGDDGVRMLCVATIIPRKGHDVLIDALAPLASLHWHLTCVGSLTRNPVTVQRLHAQLQQRRLTGRVTLRGDLHAAALTQLFRDSDLFVLPTRFEGYGMAVAEALAHGLPIISTRTGAIADLVGAEAGLLVSPGDSGALRDALARVLQQPALLAALAHGAAAVSGSLPRWPQACEHLSVVLAGIG